MLGDTEFQTFHSIIQLNLTRLSISAELVTMNTTIRYWFPHSQQCRYMSFKTYTEALQMIKLFSQIEVKAEVQV